MLTKRLSISLHQGNLSQRPWGGTAICFRNLNPLLRDRRHLRLHKLSRSRRTRPCRGHHRRFDGYDFEAAALPFRLAKFEGDAAFVYAVSEKADGSLLQDAAECAYFAFRKRLRNIKLATTCECSACDKMQTLDLKFVCHHGEFIKHRMGGREELVGRDVILVHRLLENVVNERLGGAPARLRRRQIALESRTAGLLCRSGPPEWLRPRPKAGVHRGGCGCASGLSVLSRRTRGI